jgi:hypothetical protein
MSVKSPRELRNETMMMMMMRKCVQSVTKQLKNLKILAITRVIEKDTEK